MKACIAHAQVTQAGILNLSHLGLEMDSIPPELSKLSELGTLDLQGNKIKTIPPDIGKLKNLKYLNMNRNALTFVPKEIFELGALEYLELADNQIVAFEAVDNASALPALASLRAIQLGGNKLERFPEVLCHDRIWNDALERYDPVPNQNPDNDWGNTNSTPALRPYYFQVTATYHPGCSHPDDTSAQCTQ